MDRQDMAFGYAAQILGLSDVADIPEGIANQIYWSNRGIQKVTGQGRSLRLEEVACICAPALKTMIEEKEKVQMELQAKADAAAKKRREESEKRVEASIKRNSPTTAPKAKAKAATK